MPKSLSPSVRRKIINFDPTAAGAVSITKFCRELGITRQAFYKIKKRYQQEGNQALNPHSSAPHAPVTRTYGDATVETVLRIRQRLGKAGWDNGPKSIWFDGIDSGEFTDPVPSVSTIARILSDTGVTAANPRKRPRSSLMRFTRSAAMELWQLDAFEYRLHDTDTTVVTVYQLVDDATRFDVGTRAFPDPENSRDAITALGIAITEYGVPQEILSDNSRSFNQSRLGTVSATERFLADQGCWAISGRFSHPQTQGKNERVHQTLLRFLRAQQPASMEQLDNLIDEYRVYYNYRRHHQRLPGSMTPGQAVFRQLVTGQKSAEFPAISARKSAI